MDEERLRRHLLVGFEYCWLHDDWVNPVSEALERVSAQDALWRPRSDSKGIWDIMLHVALWNENIVERVSSGQKSRPREESWPTPPEEPDEALWEDAKQRLIRSLQAIRTMLETEPMEKILTSAYGLEDILCRFHHIAYHLGQITKLRELQGI